MSEARVAWLFPGQGAQHTGMGRELFDGSPAARAVFEKADRILGSPITSLCFEGPEEDLQQTQNAQPALFVTSLACLEASRELGGAGTEQPVFVAGHSLGEYTALVAAGAVDFEHGLRLVHERGRLMREAAMESEGAMAAIIGLGADVVRSICDETNAEVCNLNAPGQTVIGGAAGAVDAAMAAALERGAQRGVRLKVSGAFHTSLMQPAVEGMRRAVADTPLRDPDVPVIANTTARPLATAAAVAEELVEQLARPVRWQQSVEYLAQQGVGGVVEFGPGRVLTGLVRRIDRSIAVRNVSDLASARSGATPSPTPP